METLKNLFRILKNKTLFEKITITATIIIIALAIIFSANTIGWYTVATSVGIGIIYDEIKNSIKEINKIGKEQKKIEEKKEKK